MARRVPDAAGFELLGAKEFEKLLAALGPSVNRRMRRTALRKAASEMAKKVRRRAPRTSGALRKSIGAKNGRFSSFVGLNRKLGSDGKVGKKSDSGARLRFYYKTLDMISERGAPLSPWFEAAVEANSGAIGADLLEAYKKELARQAGRAYARSVSRTGFKERA